MNEVRGINRHEWKHVAHASPDDFKMLVAAEEWKTLDNLAAKVRHYADVIEPTEDQLDFLALYDLLSDQMEANPTVFPAWIVRLVRGE